MMYNSGMKKFLSLVLLILLTLTITQKTFAQSSSPSALAKPATVEYYLPYPGLLPDSPLYFVKAFRDNAVSFFISDSLKKADYYLLMADKRLVSANALIDKKKYELAITTLSKAENYFEKAVQLVGEAKKQGRDANQIIDKLLIASQKHQGVIFQMVQKTKGDTRYTLELNQVRAKNFQDRLTVIKAQ